MRVKAIINEYFQDYKKPSMFIATCFCNYKCCTDQDIDISECQNSNISKMPIKTVSDSDIIKQYRNNPITEAIIFGGLEPFFQFAEMRDLIALIRQEGIQDDIVIYTGYYPHEIILMLESLKCYSNIIVKFGRYKKNAKNKYDELLGVDLISDNQYACKIS